MFMDCIIIIVTWLQARRSGVQILEGAGDLSPKLPDILQGSPRFIFKTSRHSPGPTQVAINWVLEGSSIHVITSARAAPFLA
jgi:hypothetical protein